MLRTNLVALFFVLISFFPPAFVSAQEVVVEETIECFGDADECDAMVETYINMHPNGGVRVQDSAIVGGSTSVLAVDTGANDNETEEVVERPQPDPQQVGATFRIGGATLFGSQLMYGGCASVGFSLRASAWQGELGGCGGTDGDQVVHSEFARMMRQIGSSRFSLGPELRSVVAEGAIGGGNDAVAAYLGLAGRFSFGPNGAIGLDASLAPGIGFAEPDDSTATGRRTGAVILGSVGLSVDIVQVFRRRD